MRLIMSAGTHYNSMHCTDRSGMAFCNSTLILEVQDLNLSPETNYHDWIFRWDLLVSPQSPTFPRFRLVFTNILPAETYGSRGKSINTVTRYNFEDRDLILDKKNVFCDVGTGHGTELGTHVLCTGTNRPKPEALCLPRLPHSVYTELYVLSPIRLQDMVISKAQ
jgi:hypothetical protein